ncbi:MAG TPA: tRNA pseudouridine(55) synthase TruB, partial [Pirellulales bacterium]
MSDSESYTVAEPFGLLNVFKPAGWTSRDVVNRVQRMLKPLKVGHAGTLDPLAEGVLVVCVGAATRLVEFVQRQRKEYAATYLLGRESNTEDTDGEIRFLPDPPVPTRESVEEAARLFVGDIMQRPPAFSAIKVGGKRAYDLARRGEEVELEPRKITVYRLEIEDYRYPELKLRMACSSGTYVRSIGRDLAIHLGTAAVTSVLVREAVGAFRLTEAVRLEQVDRAALLSHLKPAVEAVVDLPRIELSPDQIARVLRGQAVRLPPDAFGEELAAVDECGRLVSI